ncbi:Pkinase-domain-containing protein [Dentipellis sp. KUC8613]|nr:Pkinase-domain-containing protein [Dentipellis sp. KUC8613]
MAAQTSSAVSVRQIYQCVEQVGKGAFGSVHKGRHIPSGKVVAIKIVDLDSEDADDDVLSMQREVALLTQLRGGPNIINYYGCFLDGPRVWIIMDYADGGSVRDFIENSPSEGIEEKFAVIITREVLVGLAYLHKCAVIHRDIKAANVLVTSTGKVLICDFGVSAILATTVGKRNTFIGTPFWMAPEIAAPSPSYDTKADIWSLGILVYEMIKGNPPHLGVAPLKLIQMLPTMKPARFLENEASVALREFLPLCLTEVPGNRFTADELLKTKWIKASAKVPVTSLRSLLNRLAESKSDDVVPSENSDQNDQEFK